MRSKKEKTKNRGNKKEVGKCLYQLVSVGYRRRSSGALFFRRSWAECALEACRWLDISRGAAVDFNISRREVIRAEKIKRVHSHTAPRKCARVYFTVSKCWHDLHKVWIVEVKIIASVQCRLHHTQGKRRAEAEAGAAEAASLAPSCGPLRVLVWKWLFVPHPESSSAVKGTKRKLNWPFRARPETPQVPETRMTILSPPALPPPPSHKGSASNAVHQTG